MKKLIFIMGVSGCGKSTIGKLLSQELQIPFFDGDDFHSKENIAKMSRGQALTDDDRQAWLKSLNDFAKKQLSITSCIIACSALKQSYRDLLCQGIESQTKWIHLNGSFEQITKRINTRKDHFMSSELLQSQFDILEENPRALQFDIGPSPNEIVDNIIKQVFNKSEIGLFGLGVMGKSLSRNLAANGFKISMYNRHLEGIEEHIASDFKNENDILSNAAAFDDLEKFVNSLQKPRKILLMVNSGKTIDLVINDLLAHLSEGDIVMDGGNSNYKKTKKRAALLRTKNMYFIGIGISGGEEGALNGPSIMPGGDLEAYKKVEHFLKAISAKDENNLPCCTYIGNDGAGHFVKMVHNGIEYVEMQLLAEVFGILKSAGKNPGEIADILETWKTSGTSYLLEITIEILRKKEKNDWLINKILDKAGNKGTGNWATVASAELGVPGTLMATALFARYTSTYKLNRIKADKNFRANRETKLDISTTELLNAYQFARIINHYQGFQIISQASITYAWDLNISEIARIWTEGCIIKSDLMSELVDTLKHGSAILISEYYIEKLKSLQPAIKNVVAQCIISDVPIPCLSESINFFNAYKTANSSANLIQAQRDFFGAHTYQRIDDETGNFYHTHWK